jgi:hypothetical protein
LISFQTPGENINKSGTRARVPEQLNYEILCWKIQPIRVSPLGTSISFVGQKVK